MKRFLTQTVYNITQGLAYAWRDFELRGLIFVLTLWLLWAVFIFAVIGSLH